MEMKIMYVHNILDTHFNSGAEAILLEQITASKKQGHSCILVKLSDNKGLYHNSFNGVNEWHLGIKNIYWPFNKKKSFSPLKRFLWHLIDIYNIFIRRYIIHIVKIEQPDLVCIHNISGWSSTIWNVFNELGIPTVQVLHDYYAICVKTTMYNNNQNCSNQCTRCHAFRFPHRKLSQNLQAVVGVSRYILEKHLSLGYFENVKIQRVIHNARSPTSLGLDMAHSPTLHQGLRFGFIGRLHPTKGISLLIEAFIAVDLTDTKLLIAGSGKEQFEAQLHSQIHNRSIQFLGRVTPRDFYPQVDVVVVPSLWHEPLGMVVAEALAFGKPVIASRRGGIPEMICHGENGLLFEPDSPGELESALKAMCDDNLRTKLTAKARPSSLPFTDIDRWVSTYEALYQEVIAAHKRNPLI